MQSPASCAATDTVRAPSAEPGRVPGCSLSVDNSASRSSAATRPSAPAPQTSRHRGDFRDAVEHRPVDEPPPHRSHTFSGEASAQEWALGTLCLNNGNGYRQEKPMSLVLGRVQIPPSPHRTKPRSLADRGFVVPGQVPHAPGWVTSSEQETSGAEPRPDDCCSLEAPGAIRVRTGGAAPAGTAPPVRCGRTLRPSRRSPSTPHRARVRDGRRLRRRPSGPPPRA